MRYSKQRETVYSVLCATDAHPDVAYIYRETRKILPDISLGTVYRNLNELVAEGLIKRVSAEGGAERFDANIEPHAHLVCVGCGKITDVKSSRFNLTHELDGVVRAEVTLYGLCDACRQNRSE